MAGHNKWSKIKRLKGALDVKRGRLFSRLAKEIVVATRMGGGNSSTDPACGLLFGPHGRRTFQTTPLRPISPTLSRTILKKLVAKSQAH